MAGRWVLALSAILVLAGVAPACGGGGGSGKAASGKGGGPPAQARGGGQGSDTGGGPPAGVGQGHIPANAGAGGTQNPNAPPDRDTSVVRPGRWVLAGLTGQIVAHAGGPCPSTQVTYDPDAADGFGRLELTGDGRVQLAWTWVVPGTRADPNATAPPNAPPPYVNVAAPPSGSITWTQEAVTGQTPDGALKVQATFSTPSMLVGRWQYQATTIGNCTGQAQGQGTWSAKPT